MFKWFKKDRQPFIWAVKDSQSRVWNKVVSYERPTVMHSWHLLGKFRSEVDCEEYCDRANLALCDKVKFYKSTIIKDAACRDE